MTDGAMALAVVALFAAHVVAEAGVGDGAEDGEPRALPIERANIEVPVTTPRSFHSTDDCAAIRVGAATKPMPSPMTKQVTPTCQIELVGRSSVSPATPTGRRACRSARSSGTRPQVDPARERRGDRPAQRQRREREAGDQRAVAGTLWA